MKREAFHRRHRSVELLVQTYEEESFVQQAATNAQRNYEKALADGCTPAQAAHLARGWLCDELNLRLGLSYADRLLIYRSTDLTGIAIRPRTVYAISNEGPRVWVRSEFLS